MQTLTLLSPKVLTQHPMMYVTRATFVLFTFLPSVIIYTSLIRPASNGARSSCSQRRKPLAFAAVLIADWCGHEPTHWHLALGQRLNPDRGWH